MWLNEHERNIVVPLCYAVSILNKEEESFTFKWRYGTEICAVYVTTDEDDNGLEIEDPNYEEFIAFIVRIIKLKNFNPRDGFKKHCLEKGVLFEFNYHNFPDEIYNSKGELISKRED